MITRLNNKLLTIFLSLGIVFFLAFIFLFVNNEILDKINSNHSVNLKSIKIIKNDLAIRIPPDSLVNEEEYIMNHTNDRSFKYKFKLVNTKDSITYVESNFFNLLLLKPSSSVNFYNENSFIPYSTLKNDFKLVLNHYNKGLYEFDLKKSGCRESITTIRGICM